MILSIFDMMLLSLPLLGALLSAMCYMTVVFNDQRAARRIDAEYNTHVESH